MPRTPDRTAAVLRLVRRRGAMPALVTALGVGLYLVLGASIGQWQVVVTATDPNHTGLFFGPWDIWGGFVLHLLTTVLPVVLGFFVSFWLVAPIAEVLQVRHVIARSILATGIAVTLSFVVGSVVAVVMASMSPWMATDGFALPVEVLSPVPIILGEQLREALALLLRILPLGVLAGVLLWLWRQKHPAEYEIAGLIDV